MPFKPTDFTQVNAQVNRVLVGYALRLLDVAAHERVMDWFCGLGNFTLPLATLAAEVVGFEGSKLLVARAQDNAAQARRERTGGSFGSTSFQLRNLFEMGCAQLVQDGSAHKWLLDPPREGAFALVKALCELRRAGMQMAPGADPVDAPVAQALQALAGYDWTAPSRIVYVSCNPATLARDAALLVHQGGYRCSAAGVVNMFPHTAHVESIAVFDRVD